MTRYWLLGTLITFAFVWSSILFETEVASSHFSVDPDEELSRRKRSLPTEEEAQIIVDKHNELRATVGSEGEEPIPSDMRYMTWDDGLAYTSLIYAKQCKWEHSTKPERKTDHWTFDNGENLWVGNGILAQEFDPVYGIMKWYNEYVDYEFYNQTCTPGKLCGHYTQVVWAASHKIGCAWNLCHSMKNFGPEMADAMYMVCHYAPGGNINGVKLYKVGERCAECHPKDTCPDNALCRNPKRDKLIPFTSSSSSTAAILVTLVLLLAGLAVGAYYWHRTHGSFNVMAWRKNRRVSSADKTQNGDGAKSENGNTENGDKAVGAETATAIAE